MNRIYFENHQNIIFNELVNAQEEILISVAWLNFQVYSELFIKLATSGIKIKIIVNDDHINNRHKEALDLLKELGIKIKKISMLSPKNYMHHKFCIIDKKKILIGSFNWSKNAQYNFENLLVLDDENIINSACNEFKHLWKINKKFIKLQRDIKCYKCKCSKYNLLILNDDNNHTEYKIVSVCECDDYVEISSGYMDISLYNSIMGIFNNYNEQIDYVRDFPKQIDILEQECEYDLMLLFKKLLENDDIDGMALLKYDIYSQDGDGEWITKVIWKHRFAYSMQEEYYNTFNII
ncbi:phospholipase D-like domain-containing protein [Lysinibacillus fusiformis]|uniref:phospholipase D-like domain-containing protein n=1 Tax=Lysinibacillus fusiformis TaxID=28031 RepID=UPI00371481DD